jgi:hypothetical protein
VEEGSSGRTGSSEERVTFDDQLREIRQNCFRYLGFKTFDEVDQLTIAEYNMHMECAVLNEIDKEYYVHLQAFANFKAKARKKNGRPVYNRFDKFYDREARIASVKRKTQRSNNVRFPGVGKLLSKGE